MFSRKVKFTKFSTKMTTISKPGVHLLCDLLHAYGIRHVVVSSGSRCAPLSVALARMGCFVLHPVIDERSAGFIALGISLTLDEPVAMVCTSGSAALNYAPALAEAYYRRVPLVAITADRPARYIDQREGQTIHQFGALDAVVRKSIDVPDCGADKKSVVYINRIINEALTVCTGCIKGPVHINMQLEVPLTEFTYDTLLPKATRIMQPALIEEKIESINIGLTTQNPRILLLIGGVRLSERDKNALKILAKTPNIAIISETQTNIHGAINPSHCERILDEAPKPNIVAIIGGDLISTRFKQWLRKLSGVYFVSGGYEDCLVDTFGQLNTHIDCEPAAFFEILADMKADVNYRAEWERLAAKGLEKFNTDRLCINIFQALADRFTGNLIHISNGTSARIAQYVNFKSDVTVEINRGVSGIDGSTSTAVGAAMVNNSPTLLISGDMSAAYDIGALATLNMPSGFKMAVLDNSGGDIFRNIPSTSELPELDELFVMKPKLPLRELAGAYGFGYFECADAKDSSIEQFINHTGPAILRIAVAPKDSAGFL